MYINLLNSLLLMHLINKLFYYKVTFNNYKLIFNAFIIK